METFKKHYHIDKNMTKIDGRAHEVQTSVIPQNGGQNHFQDAFSE